MINQGDTDSAANLDSVLTWNLTRVARFVGNRLADRMSSYGINPIQFGVLAFLNETPRMSTAEISRAVLLRPQSVVALLDGMEEKDLIRRIGPRKRGRPNPVEVTPAGRQKLEDVWSVAVGNNDLTDAGLTVEESAELNRLLLKVALITHGSVHPGS